MKIKNYLSILLCTAMFASTAMVFNGCGNEQNEPENEWNDGNGNDDSSDNNNDGEDDDSNSSSDYFIKHPWGGGSWSWQRMSRYGSNYTYTGKWGGVGANINTKADDSNSDWIPESDISGASGISNGTSVTFTYHPSSKSLSVSTNGGGNNDNNDDNGNDNGGNNGDDNGGGNGGNNGGDNGDSTTKPEAPTGLNATKGGPLMYPYVSLSWNSVSNADSYNIYRAASANGSYSKIGNSSSASYTDNSPKDGDNFYKVTAVNKKGESAKSDYAQCTIDKNATKPGFKSIKGSVSGNNLTLKWTLASGAGYGKAARVEVYVYDPNGLDGEGWYQLKTFTGSGIDSGSYTLSLYTGYLYYNSVRMALSAANEYGEDKRTIIYIPDSKTWNGTF